MKHHKPILTLLLLGIFAGGAAVGCCSHPELKAAAGAIAKDIPIFVAHSQPKACSDPACCKGGVIDPKAWDEYAGLLKKNAAALGEAGR